MKERERLIELLKQPPVGIQCQACYQIMIETIVDRLIENGVIVLPCDTVYHIVDAGTEYARVFSEDIRDLHVYEVEDLRVCGYWLTEEEAKKALEYRKGGVE